MANQNQYNVKIIEYESEIRYKIYKNEVNGKNKKTSIERIKNDIDIWNYAKMQFSLVVNQLYEIKSPDLIYLDVIETEYKNEFLAWLEISQEDIIKDFENLQKITRETFVQEYIKKEEKYINDSKSRSIQKVYDVGKSNKWDWFLTLTFDEKKVDRYNYEELTKKLSKFFNNTKTENPDFKYLAVPEQHKDGAYHFHMLSSGLKEEYFINSGIKTKKGLDIYNFGKYKFGFTTATKITDSNKAVGYICKYLTKELIESVPKGKKRYWTSKNLDKPKETNIYISPEYIEEFQEKLKKEKEYKYLKEININTPEYKNKMMIIEFSKE